MKNTLKNNYVGAKSSLNTISASINSNIGITNYDEDKILDFVNTNRKCFRWKPHRELKSNILKKESNLKHYHQISGVNTQLLKNDLDKLQKINSDKNKENISNIDLELRELKAKISSDHRMEDALDHLKLTRLGIGFIRS